MLTHEIIKSETDELALLLKNGSVLIPTLWSCLWPGLLYVIALTVLTTCVAYTSDSSHDGVASVAFTMLFGFILSLGLFSMRSLYLSIPASFRESSMVMKVLMKKVRIYFTIYCLLTVSIAFFVGAREISTMIFTAPHVFIAVFIVLCFNADISRYRLSAMMTVVGLFKKHK